MSWDGGQFVAAFSDDNVEIPLFVYATNDSRIAESFLPYMIEVCKNRYAIFATVKPHILKCLEPEAVPNFSVEQLVVGWVRILAGEPEYETLPSIKIAIDLKKSGLSQHQFYVMVQRMLDHQSWEVEMFGES